VNCEESANGEDGLNLEEAVNGEEGANIEDGSSPAAGQTSMAREASAAPPPHSFGDLSSILISIVGQQAITTSPVDDTMKLALGSCPENQQLISVKLR
jgi:hypothetical protein